MDLNLAGFHALVTGGSSGMGYEMAKALSAHGATVAAVARGGEKLDKAAQRFKDEGFGGLSVLAMDVRSEASVNSVAKWVEENWGRIDMLVNNAGIGMGAVKKDFSAPPLPSYEVPVDVFNDMVSTNFIGHFLTSRAFLPMMVKQRSGRIVNVSTGFATLTAQGQMPYGPAKAGMEAMSTIMGEELKDMGIMVNVILPGGATDTGLIPEGSREIFVKRGNLQTPDILNETILFFASPKAEGIYNQRILGREFHQWLEEKGMSI